MIRRKAFLGDSEFSGYYQNSNYLGMDLTFLHKHIHTYLIFQTKNYNFFSFFLLGKQRIFVEYHEVRRTPNFFLTYIHTTLTAFNISSMLLTFSNFIFELEKKEVQILKERK